MPETMHPASLRVGLMHAPPVAGDMAANWATFERLAEDGANHGVDLCMSPECFLDGYAVSHAHWERDRLMEAGRETARVYLPRLRDLARRLGIMLLFGATYTDRTKCLNSAFLVERDGTVIGRYDKTHLLDHDLRFDAGNALPVFETRLGTLGIMICADRRWPETARTLRVKGARVILNPTYGMHGAKNTWWMCTRSYENECWICFAHPLQSLVTSPHGDVHAEANTDKPGVLVTDLNLRGMPTTMFEARRPELYAAIAWRKHMGR
jgi:predicted amidohydrolase